MAQHGYLGENLGSEYDPGYDPDDDDRRERSSRDRDWRGEDRNRWRDDDRGSRSGGFMFDDRDRNQSSWRDDDRYRAHRSDRDRDDEGFFSRIGDEARSWFSDDEHDGGRSGRDFGRLSRDRGSSAGQYGSSRAQGERQRFSNHPDDHYRSWRDRQMQALDRDYADYCREREQQFHQEFDSWRQNRRRQGSSSGRSSSESDTSELQLTAGEPRSDGTQGMTTDPADAPQATTSPEGTATLGTNNSENSAMPGGRRR